MSFDILSKQYSTKITPRHEHSCRDNFCHYVTKFIAHKLGFQHILSANAIGSVKCLQSAVRFASNLYTSQIALVSRRLANNRPTRKVGSVTASLEHEENKKNIVSCKNKREAKEFTRTLRIFSIFLPSFQITK